jgi:hypothetical protein
VGGVGGVTELWFPQAAEAEVGVADHVGRGVRADGCGVELRVAGDGGGDDQAAVLGTFEGQMIAGGDTQVDQIPDRGSTASEAGGLVDTFARRVPSRAALTAAADAGDGIDAAGAYPGQDRRGEGGGRQATEASIGVSRVGRGPVAGSAGSTTYRPTRVPSSDG